MAHPFGELDMAPRHASYTPQSLLSFVAGLAVVRTFEELTGVTTQAVRDLLGADGATFVLRDGECCFYVDEDAISPLWKGSRFPLETCVSGWAMMHGEAAAISDIYQDERIPVEAYRPTFVRSLIMAPVPRRQPVAALGAYWSAPRRLTDAEVELLQTIADAAALAVAHVRRAESAETAPAHPAVAALTSRAAEARLPSLVERTRRRLRPESAAAFAVAAGLVVTAALARLGLETIGGPGIAPLVTYYPAVLGATLLGGTRPALFAAVASSVIAGVSLERPGPLLASLTDPTHLLNIALFLTISLCIVCMPARYRRALRRLSEDEALHVGLTREIQHRMRNALSVIQAIVTQSLKADPAQADVLNQRIQAGLSDLALDATARAESLALSCTLAQHLRSFGFDRFDFAGADPVLPPDQQRIVALCLHELATNAAKYGALSRPGGRVAISWRSEASQLVIEWRERGGPPVHPPMRRGYGSVFLTRLLKASGGDLSVAYPPQGVAATIVLAG